MIDVLIKDIISNSVELAIISNKIFNRKAPIGTIEPYLVFNSMVSNPLNSKSGLDVFEHYYRFSVYTKNQTDKELIFKELIKLFNRSFSEQIENNNNIISSMRVYSFNSENTNDVTAKIHFIDTLTIEIKTNE